MRRRGFVFTLDALLALVLLMVFVGGIIATSTEIGENVYITAQRMQDKRTAEGVLLTLKTTPLKDLVPPQVIEQWVSQGILNLSIVSPDMTPVQILATYWALNATPVFASQNLDLKATEIIGYVLNETLGRGYDYQMFIANYTSPFLQKLDNTNLTEVMEISPATLLLSGYAYNRTPLGYMARAYLTKISHRYSRLMGIQRVVAGGCYYYYRRYYPNDFKAYYNFTLPGDMKLLYADARFAKRSAYDSMDVYLNGNLVFSSPAGYFTTPLIPNSTLSKYLKNGNNTLYFSESADCSYYPSSIEEGFGSGSTMLVEYLTNSTLTQNPNTLYLYDIDSKHTGFVHFVTVIPTGNVTGMNIHLEVSGVAVVRIYYQFGATVYSLINTSPVNGVVDVTSAQIESALERYGISYANLSQHSFTLAIGFDAKYDQGYGTWLYAGQSYDQTAIQERHLYGFGKSWVKLSVIPRTLQTMYSIPMAIPLGYSNFTYTLPTRYGYTEVYVSYYLPPYATPWYADYWVAIQYSPSYINVNNKLHFWENSVTNGTIYYGNLDLYLYRFGYSRFKPALMVPGQTNTFYMKSYDPYYVFRYNQTRGIVYYFIQAFSGYSGVFPKLLQGYPTYRGYNLTYYSTLSSTPRRVLVGQAPYLSLSCADLKPTQYAVDDALVRLFQKFALYNTTNPIPGTDQNPLRILLSSQVQVDFVSMGNIPNMYPPIVITLRVWREKP